MKLQGKGSLGPYVNSRAMRRMPMIDQRDVFIGSPFQYIQAVLVVQAIATRSPSIVRRYG